VTRLKEGNVGSVTQKQCAVFDAFGNILGIGSPGPAELTEDAG